MTYGSTPAVASGPFSASGTVVAVDAVTKPKKAGGTFTVNIARLNTGVEIDFGFKPCPFRVGDTVNLEVMKKYGKYEFAANMGMVPSGAPAAFPARAAAAPVAASSEPAKVSSATAPASSYFSGKPFPLPQAHGDTAIIRQNALTNSVKLHGDLIGGKTSDEMPSVADHVNAIIKTAYKLAAFSSGNLDAELIEHASEKAGTKSVKAAKLPASLAGIGAIGE